MKSTGKPKQSTIPDLSTFLVWLFISLACLTGALWSAPPLVDDAFITFRYAQNLAALGELRYNPPFESSGVANVLGTSSPGFAIYLAAAMRAGLAPERLALWTGLFSIFFVLTIGGYSLWAPRLGLMAAAAIFPTILLSYFIQVSSVSGMETGLYCGIVVGVLLLLERKRFAWCAALASIATLLRPDGAVLLVISFYLSLRDSKRTAPVVLGVCMLILGPWLLYCWQTFGTLLPHSVAAKQVIHPGSLLINATVLTHFLLLSPSLLLLMALGFSGLILSSATQTRSAALCRISLMWCLAYLAGLLFSGVRPIFFWYIAPPALVCGVIGIPAFLDFARSSRSAPPLRALLQGPGARYLIIALALVSIGEFAWRGRSLDQEQTRHLAYQDMAATLAPVVVPGERVFLCETGILGFHLPQATILDSAGLTSQELLSIRKENPTGWLTQMIRLYQPDWLISPKGWCELSSVTSKEPFQSEYQLFHTSMPSLQGGVVAFRRTTNNSNSENENTLSK